MRSDDEREGGSSTPTVFRNEPVQARSAARLEGLLDAAAAVVQDIGYERLTTAMVAEKAGSSIGTVYRYFPDRIALLQALSARYLSRFEEEGVPRVASAENATWVETIDALQSYWLDAYRHQPGFRSLRFGDDLDLRPRGGPRSNIGGIATQVAAVLQNRHGVTDDDLDTDIEVALTALDATLARAFAFDDAGDDAYVEAALALSKNYLLERHGKS